MSERGTFVLDRGWFDHPVFKDETYTQREAWAWMIAQAAYRPHRRRIGAAEVALSRGQLAASLRFMAEKFKWPEANVRRFLARLRRNAMIDAATDAGITVLTIRNYDRYQWPNRTIDASSDAVPTQHRRKGEEREIRKELAGAGEPPANRSVSEEAYSLTKEIAQICGFADVEDWPPGWCGAPLRVHRWLSEQWPSVVIIAACRETMARKRDGPPNSINFFEKAVARAVAQQAAPLPIVVINNTKESLHAQARQVQSSGSAVAAIQRLREKIANQPGSGEPADGDPVFRLSKG
jgi:hypothetical protein